MGRKELQKEHSDNLMNFEESSIILQNVALKCAMIRDNFDSIIDERMEIADKFGETHVLEGPKSNPKEGTIGTLEAFAKGTKYYGNPFLEVSRNMGSHLKAYCISKGLTDEELESMSLLEPPEETKNKIREMKKDFLKMVYDMDKDKVAEFYADLAGKVENDIEKMQDIATLAPDKLESNSAVFLKYYGSQSYWSQTTDYKGSNETEDIREMVGMCNDKLEQRGKKYDFENLHLITNIDFAVQSFSTKKFGAQKTEIAPAILQMGFGKLAGMQIMAERKGMVGTKNEKLANSCKDPNEYDGEFFAEAMMKSPEEMVKEGQLRTSVDVDGLKNEMQSNVRTVWGIKRKNSPEYQAVLDSLTAISDLNKADKKDEKAIDEQYKILEAATKKYLDGRDPSTKSGEDRYRLVLRAKDISDGYALNAKMREAEAKYKEEKRNKPVVKEQINAEKLAKESGVEKPMEKTVPVFQNNSPTKTADMSKE